MSKKSGSPTDMRAYRRKTERALAWAVVVMLLVVGSAMIGLIYGWQSVIAALLCLLPGAGAFGLVWLLLGLIERFVKD